MATMLNGRSVSDVTVTCCSLVYVRNFCLSVCLSADLSLSLSVSVALFCCLSVCLSLSVLCASLSPPVASLLTLYLFVSNLCRVCFCGLTFLSFFCRRLSVSLRLRLYGFAVCPSVCVCVVCLCLLLLLQVCVCWFTNNCPVGPQN